jgi:hypothetical protein
MEHAKLRRAAQLDLPRAFGLQAGVGDGGPEALAEPLEDGGKAGAGGG